VTVLGRPDNVEAVTGMHRVAVAGTQPWQPAVVVHDDGTVVVLPFTWDREQLAVSALDAIGGAHEIAVDGITPWWRDRLGVRLVPYVSASRPPRNRGRTAPG